MKRVAVLRSAARNVRQQRTQRGEALFGGVAAVILFILISLPVGIFFVNVSSQLIVQSQVAHVANQAAAIVDAHRYWLDQPRPGFNASDAERKAQSAARIMCDRLDLPPVRVDVNFGRSSDDPDIDTTTVEVTVDVTRRIPFRVSFFGYDFGKLFPTALSARGVSAHARQQPYALMHLEAPATAFGDQRGASADLSTFANNRETAIIPLYAFGAKVKAGEPDTITTLLSGPAARNNEAKVLGSYEVGAPMQNLVPDNFVSFNTYHLIKEDLDSLQAGRLKQVSLTGWHKNRVFNGVQAPPANDVPGVGLTP